jgi:uncharacterized membrane protein YfcA
MLKKLKAEWKTALVATLGAVVGAYDAVVAAGYTPSDFAPIIPEQWKPYAPLVFGLLMLGLRRWNDVVHK